MHIADGALSGPVLIGGFVLAAGGVVMGLRKLEIEKIPATGVLGATFFVASLVHIPVGVTSVHLIMNGLAGLVLGWAAFPALAVALLLQAVFFGFGGLTVLGVNAFNIAMPAVLVYYLFRPGVVSRNSVTAGFAAFGAGFGAITFTTVFLAISLLTTGSEFLATAWLAFGAHIPVMIIEGFVSLAAVQLIRRVQPGLFSAVMGPVPEASPRWIWAVNLMMLGVFVGLPLGYLAVPGDIKASVSFLDLFTEADVAGYFLIPALLGGVVAILLGAAFGPRIEAALERRAQRRLAAAEAESLAPRPAE